MKFVADENVEKAVIEELRRSGHDIVAVRDVLRGAADDVVLQFANTEDRILLTNDTDFGQMVFQLRLATRGIVLIRCSSEASQSKIKALKYLLKFHEKKLAGHFTVVSEHQIKIRPLAV